MYKLLIVDDEQLVLESISYIIKKSFTDIVVSNTARSGREAIEKAEVLMPDLIFMDINMPGINGIEAIKEIKSRFPSIYVVILTAYEQFEFAQDAIGLGVKEYILKPVTREKVIEIVKSSIETIRQEKEKRKRELEMKEKLKIVIPVLENGFIYSILFFDHHTQELQNYKNIMNITKDGGYMMTIEFGEIGKGGDIENKIGLSVRSQNFYPYVKDLIQRKCKAIVGPVMLNRIVIFVPLEITRDEYNQRLEALSSAEYIYRNLVETVEADFYIGIGRAYKGTENLLKSYEESLKAIHFSKQKGFYHIMDISVECKTEILYPIIKEKSLIENLTSGNTEAALRDFKYIFDYLSNTFTENISNIKNHLLELMVLINRHVWDYNVEGLGDVENLNYLEKFQSIGELSQLRAWCWERVGFISKSISESKEKNINSIIAKAQDYIEDNYFSEITLDEISRDACISPHYFCTLFKNETGENFIDYLTNVRIQKAKELLDKDELSVKEIGYKVGYGDANYFSRIFKKIVGKTATEYKDRL